MNKIYKPDLKEKKKKRRREKKRKKRGGGLILIPPELTLMLWSTMISRLGTCSGPVLVLQERGPLYWFTVRPTLVKMSLQVT